MFGERLKSLREKKGWSQATLGALVGVKQPYVADLEAGNRLPSDELLKKLAAHLGTPARELILLLPHRHIERSEEEHVLLKYGGIMAGPRCSSQEGDAERVDLRKVFPPDCILLEVQGNSLSGLGVYPGDHIAVRKGQTAHDGDLVVAEIDGEYTLKAKFGDKLLECRDGKPPKSIDLHGTNVTVEGVVVQVFGARRFPPKKLPRR